MSIIKKVSGQIAAFGVSCLLSAYTLAQLPNESAPPAAAAPADGTARPPANTSPPPGDEVMHPTERGVRLTPAMARAFSRLSVSAMRDEFKLAPEQEQKLAQAYASRIMQTARKYEEQGQNLSEAAIETMWSAMSSGKGMEFTPEMGRDLGNRALPAMPGLHELMDGFVSDAEPILSPESMEKLRKKMAEGQKELDKFEQRMQRWAQGQMKPGEDPFNDRGDETAQPANDPNGQNQAVPRQKKTPEVERAERNADSTLQFAGVNEWTMFKSQVENYFKFDDQQKAKAEQILAGYRAKADAIMTPQWKDAMRQNRIKINLRSQIKGVPTAPWSWRMEYEYSQALKPVKELGWAFKKEMLSLVTRAQREAALTDLGARAAEQGLTVEDKDHAVLGLSASNWNFWKF